MDRIDMLRRLEEGEDPLELSIEKWQDIVDGTGEDRAMSNCALCETYEMDSSTRCGECPLFDGYKKGEPCTRHYYYYTHNPTKENAQKVLDTLLSLRPKPKVVEPEFKPTTIEIHLGWKMIPKGRVDVYREPENIIHINADENTIVKIENNK